jgi:hypothetical protein
MFIIFIDWDFIKEIDIKKYKPQINLQGSLELGTIESIFKHYLTFSVPQIMNEEKTLLVYIFQ